MYGKCVECETTYSEDHLHICNNCGVSVCDEHYNKESEMCTECDEKINKGE